MYNIVNILNFSSFSNDVYLFVFTNLQSDEFRTCLQLIFLALFYFNTFWCFGRYKKNLNRYLQILIIATKCIKHWSSNSVHDYFSVTVKMVITSVSLRNQCRVLIFLYGQGKKGHVIGVHGSLGY